MTQVTAIGLQSRANHTWAPANPDDLFSVKSLRAHIAHWSLHWHGLTDGCQDQDCKQCAEIRRLFIDYDALHLAHAEAVVAETKNPTLVPLI